MKTEICEKCNQPKKMYYQLFCPRCDKPELETRSFYNLFRCMYYIEANGNPGYKERLWDYLVEDVQGNDSYIEIWREQGDDNEDIKLLFDRFDIKDETYLFYVSW